VCYSRRSNHRQSKKEEEESKKITTTIMIIIKSLLIFKYRKLSPIPEATQQTGSSDDASGLYSGNGRFELWQGHLLSGLKLFVVFLRPPVMNTTIVSSKRS
jgi:hypothetical protein